MSDWSLSERAKTEWGSIAWQSFGAGPPLVFLHGTPFSSFIWRKMIKSLEPLFKVYVFDLLGYGESEKAADVSLGVQNRVFAAMLDYWRLEAPNIVAHDVGGATALRTHFLDRRDYASLILIDPVVMRPWGTPFARHVRLHEQAFGGLPPYAHDAMLRAYIQTAAHRTLPADVLNGHARPWIGATGQAAFYRQIAQFDEKHTAEIERKLGSIRCPVSVVWGEHDMWLPMSQGADLAAQFGQGDLTIVPCAGHMVQEDAPEAVIRQVLARFVPR